MTFENQAAVRNVEQPNVNPDLFASLKIEPIQISPDTNKPFEQQPQGNQQRNAVEMLFDGKNPLLVTGSENFTAKDQQGREADRKADEGERVKDGEAGTDAASAINSIAAQLKDFSLRDGAKGPYLEMTHKDGSKTRFQFNEKEGANHFDHIEHLDAKGRLTQERHADGRTSEYKYKDDSARIEKYTEKSKEGTITKEISGEQFHKERLENSAKDLGKSASRTNREEPFGDDGYVALQRMWNDAKLMGGNPMENVEKALNGVLKEKDMRVELRTPTAQDKSSGLHGTEAALSVIGWTRPAGGGNIVGKIYGLGGERNSWAIDPDVRILKPARK